MTQEELKTLLRYDPETGKFFWIHARGNLKAGAPAGASDKQGYRVIGVNGKYHKAHRLAFLYMTGKFPPDMVDHINRDTGDNRWENLREVTRSQNCQNKEAKGIHRMKRNGKWMAYIKLNGKLKHLGYFHTKDEAKSVRLAAEKQYFTHKEAA
jgi:hypothetical protein